MKRLFSILYKLIGLFIVVAAVLVTLDFLGIYKLPNSMLDKILKNEKYVITISASDGEADRLTNEVPEHRRIEVVKKEKSTLTDEQIEEYQEKINQDIEAIRQNAVEREEEQVEERVEYAGYSENSFYYNQLDEYAKKIYDELFIHRDDLKTGTYTIDFDLYFNDLLNEEDGMIRLNHAYQLAINALSYDNPGIFYISIPKVFLLTETTTYFTGRKEYRVKIGPNEGDNYLLDSFRSPEELYEANLSIERLRDSVLEIARRQESVEGQIRVVHDFLVDNTEYDTSLSRPDIYSVYGTLRNHVAVCEGYARAFKYMLDNLNIPCIIVTGVGINSSGEQEAHAWNYVQIDGIWYGVDVTWDDPIIIGGGRLDEENKHKYYLKGMQIEENHYADGYIVGEIYSFKYPSLSVYNYFD